MTSRRRYAALRGKITPRSRDRFNTADFDGTVEQAQGSAQEAEILDELEREPQTGEHELASEVAERIRAVISSAEAAANAVRHEAEQRAQVRRRVAEEEARRLVDDAKREAEAFLAERKRRIAQLSDSLVDRAEEMVMGLDRGNEVRRQLQELAESLGDSAERMARDLREGQPLVVPGTEPAEPPAAAGEPSPVADEPIAAVEEPPAADEPERRPEPSVVPDVDAGEPETADEPEADSSALESEVATAEVVELVEAPRDGDDDAGRPPEPDEHLNARLVALQMAVAGGSRSDVEVHLRRNFEVNDLGGILDDVFGDGDGSDAKERLAGSTPGDGAA